MTPRVFVSRPAALTEEQDLRYRSWLGNLAALGFEPATLDRASYETVPWEQLRTLVREADGSLILGFRQLRVDGGLWRPGTAESGVAARWWGTPWSQIEAGLALMAGLPVLVAPEDGVIEGVFRPDTWGGTLFGVSEESAPGASDAAVTEWAQAVNDHASAAARD